MEGEAYPTGLILEVASLVSDAVLMVTAVEKLDLSHNVRPLLGGPRRKRGGREEEVKQGNQSHGPLTPFNMYHTLTHRHTHTLSLSVLCTYLLGLLPRKVHFLHRNDLTCDTVSSLKRVER